MPGQGKRPAPLKISGQLFEETLLPSPEVAPRLLKIALQRLRGMEQMLKQSEKMAALGVLAAGLAHELNNPAAAVRRGAGNLRDVLAELQLSSSRLAAAGLGPSERRASKRCAGRAGPS